MKKDSRPVPTGRLVSELVATSLGRVSATYETAFPLLRKLGRLLIDNQGAPIPTADVATYAEAAPLFRSRLIVERNGFINFPLMILAEWFAARDLEAGTPPMDELVSDAERLGRWLVPLAVCLSDTGKQNVQRVMTPLASQRPAVASRLLADAFSEWLVADSVGPMPSWQELGAGIHSAMAAWVEGLECVAPLVAPVHSDGTLRTIGIRVEDSSVVSCWARRRSTQTVVQLPEDFAARATDREWLGATLRYHVVKFNGLVWMWTLGELKDNLARLLDERGLPLATALCPPWPGPERLAGGDVWSGYSPGALLGRTRVVYATALNAYCELVDRWFPRFRRDLELSARRPFRLVGMVRPPSEPDPLGRGPGICWYLEPNWGSHTVDVDLRLGSEEEQARFIAQAEHMLGSRFGGYTVSTLRVFRVDAAEKLAYSWLRNDLEQVNWGR